MAQGIDLTGETTQQARNAIRGEAGGRSGVKSNKKSAKRTKEESCQRENADSSRKPVGKPVEESLMAPLQLVQLDEHGHRIS